MNYGFKNPEFDIISVNSGIDNFSASSDEMDFKLEFNFLIPG